MVEVTLFACNSRGVEMIAGHSPGHYLTASAEMYQSTGNSEFLERANYIVKEEKECQEAIWYTCFVLNVRYPYWAEAGIELLLNSKLLLS